MKTFLKVIGVVVVIIVAIVLIATLGSSGVDARAEEVLQQLNDGEVEKVYNESLMTNDYTLVEFKDAFGIGKEYDISKAELIKWTGRGFENSEKYIYGQFKFPNGEELTLTFWFVETDDSLGLLGITEGTPDEYEE